MKRKHILLSIAALTVGLVVVMLAMSPKTHKWDMSEMPSKSGDEPYDITLVDELLKRSLPNGYQVREASIVKSELSEETPIDIIANTPIDTSLLVIQQYPWYGQKKENKKDYDTDSIYVVEKACNIPVMRDLMDFCRRGGRALFVPTNDLEYMDLLNVFRDLYSTEGYDFVGEAYYDGNKPYSKKWLRARGDDKIGLMLEDKKIELSQRYAVNQYVFDAHKLNQNRISKKAPKITPIIYDRGGKKVYAYVWEFPNGGALYVCSLGLHFTNLGLTLADERFVLEEMMGRIDDRPVVRVSYPKLPEYDYDTSDKNREAKHFAVISKNPSLRLAWILILVFAGCLIFSGLWRRQPAAKAIDVDDLDRTDFVAVREYQFRKSPLLHFLFQTSWLYNAATDYRQLFLTNYRRVARHIARISNINLANASDQEMHEVAQTLANMQGRDEKDIFEEIKWISLLALRVDKVTAKQFAKSQHIAEHYPL